MTVILYGLADIRMKMSLLEMGVQLMMLPTTSFRTMNVTPYWCFESSLVSCIRGSFSKPCPSDLGKAHLVPQIAF